MGPPLCRFLPQRAQLPCWCLWQMQHHAAWMRCPCCKQTVLFTKSYHSQATKCISLYEHREVNLQLPERSKAFAICHYRQKDPILWLAAFISPAFFLKKAINLLHYYFTKRIDSPEKPVMYTKVNYATRIAIQFRTTDP